MFLVLSISAISYADLGSNNDAKLNPPQNPVPSTGIDQRVINQLVNEAREIKKEAKKMADESKAAKLAHDDAVNNYATALRDSVETDRSLLGEVKSSNGKIDASREDNAKIIPYVSGEFHKAGEQVENSLLAVGLGLAALIIVAVLVILARTKGQVREAVEPAVNRLNTVTEEVKTEVTSVNATIGSAKDEILAAIQSSKEEIIKVVPAETASINELQRPFVLKDIHGKNYQINPVIIDGKVRTLKLVKDFDEDDYDSPSEYPRTPAKSLRHLTATNAQMLNIYFDPSLKCSALLKAVIDNAIAIGEVVEV